MEMSEIPEDIMAKAEMVYGVLESTDPNYPGSPAERLDIKVIARAIMEAEARGAERERERYARGLPLLMKVQNDPRVSQSSSFHSPAPPRAVNEKSDV
jgi:hypothetical protein